MTILFCGLINILSFYFTAKLLSTAVQKHNEMRDRLSMLEVELLDLRKQLRVLNV